MASLSDLQTAVAKIGSDITAAIADIKALSTAQPGGINPADLDPIVAASTGFLGVSGSGPAACGSRALKPSSGMRLRMFALWIGFRYHSAAMLAASDP